MRGTTACISYTKAIIEQQAAEGRDFSCEALYLDPGWDTDFRHLPLGREVARAAQAVHRRDAVEVRAEGLAALPAGHLDVAPYGHGAERRVPTYPPESRRMPPESAGTDEAA